MFFPTIILEVNMATDCHLGYTPIGQTASLSELEYMQPMKPPPIRASSSSAAPVPIKLDEGDIPAFTTPSTWTITADSYYQTVR